MVYLLEVTDESRALLQYLNIDRHGPLVVPVCTLEERGEMRHIGAILLDYLPTILPEETPCDS